MTEKTQNYINRAKEIHGDKYDYSLVTDIKTNKQKIDIICKIHGKFTQTVSSHINSKRNCPKCMNAYRKTTQEALDLFVKTHSNKYAYLPFDYKNNKQKIKIVCKEHGVFEQVIKEHINGSGCPKCAKNYKIGNMDGFLDRVLSKFSLDYMKRYDYSKCVYIGYDEEITINCITHGPFDTTPHKHLSGYGCQKCAANSSKKEKLWLDSLGIRDLKKQYRLRINGRSYLVDGYSPSLKTAYEFHGDFFHGNPKFFDKSDKNPVAKKTFGELFNKTQIKKKEIENAGYKYVFIWESDFDNRMYKNREIQSSWKGLIEKNKSDVQHIIAYENLWKYADGE